jgi:hypothetical protein
MHTHVRTYIYTYIHTYIQCQAVIPAGVAGATHVDVFALFDGIGDNGHIAAGSATDALEKTLADNGTLIFAHVCVCVCVCVRVCVYRAVFCSCVNASCNSCYEASEQP